MSIEIHFYNPQWTEIFRQTAQPIRKALGDLAVRIDHIGSTSIPSADAKPIIDIQISALSFEPFERIRLPMEGLGYVWRSDNGDLSKRYFREAPGERRTHIHVRRAGSWPEQFALLFRDYLRVHPEAVRQYGVLKRQLADQFRDNRTAYTDAKTPFIWQIMAQADQWSQATGWQPGPCDV